MKRIAITLLGFFFTFAGTLTSWNDSAMAAPPPSQSNFTLFGSTEIRSTQLTSFTNWTGMLSRFNREKALGINLCTQQNTPAAQNAHAPPPIVIQNRGNSQQIIIGSNQPVRPSTSQFPQTASTPCTWNSWQDLISRLRGMSPMQQLTEVNRLVNAHRYIIDQINWGMNDYWETVFEFLARNGDCEDFAIAKYVTLRALGWPASSLRIVILRDTQLDLNHAVLAAYTSDGIYIGDNQVKTLVKADSIHHYRPIYSINEQAWWLHRSTDETPRRY